MVTKINWAVVVLMFMLPVTAGQACPCFTSHFLQYEFTAHPLATCEVNALDDANIVTAHIVDVDSIAVSAPGNCRLYTSYHNIDNDYDEYALHHESCLKAVLQTCIKLNFPIKGSNSKILDKINDYRSY